MVLSCLASLLALVVTPDRPTDKPETPYACGHARAAAALLEQPTPPEGDSRLRGDADTDVLHYNLDLEIDPGAHWIDGSNVMTVRSLVDGLTVFYFQLDDALTITAMEIGGNAVSWTRTDFPTIEVTLDRAYNAGEEFDLLVAYDGVPSTDGDFVPAIWFTDHSGQPIVFTLSEPWYSYTWWPCKDDNTDKATAEETYIVPDTMEVASNGALLAETDLGDGRKQFDWATDYEMAPYLFAFSATNYNVYVEDYVYDGGTMPFMLYTFPEDDTASHRQAWRDIMQMMDVFGDHFGLYPFINEKHGLYQFLMGGGMEHQTCIGQGQYWGSWEWINAHELAHQWWGDMITCATWHDIWLNEGFATYGEAIWFENKPGSGGEDALHNWMEQKRPGRVDGSVYCYDISNTSRIFSGDFSYRKGGWVLHMLRHIVGDDTFFDILAAYRDAYAYSSATTDDFQNVCESVYGADLDWFFDTFVYDIGAPAYRYAWQQTTVGGQNYVELYVHQYQTSSYPIFTMPVDIVTTAGGVDTTHVVWNDAQTENLLFATDGPIDSLAFDPKVWILASPPYAQQVTFVEGPPKIVAVSPIPGTEVGAGGATAVTVQFHKDVVADETQFSLVGDNGGPVAFTFAYDSGTQTATLTPNDPLPGDSYTLTVDDTIVDVSAGLALDGEVADLVTLPSGDGLPGGDAVLIFSVAVGGDLDGDGDVDQSDLGILLADWGCNSGNCPGDCDGDGDTDQSDLGILLANWGYGT